MKVEIDVDYCIAQYESGKTIREIADELGCAWNTVQRRMIKRGVKIRNRGKRQLYCPYIFLALAEMGMSYYDIERLTGVNHSNVSTHLQKIGYRRGKGRTAKQMKTCAVCGERFEATKPNALYCGPRCKERAHGYDHIKRAKLYGAAWEKGITLDKLIERDGNVCYICGKTCDKNDQRWGCYGPDYPTQDHVVPLSKGGAHTWDNVRLSCASCNCVTKREKTINEIDVV